MAFVLLSPHHSFHVGSHSDGDLEVTQVSCTPLFADGETNTYSRDMTGLGYRLGSGRGTAGSQTETCVRVRTMLVQPLLSSQQLAQCPVNIC